MSYSRLRTVLASVVVVMLVTTALPPGVVGDHGGSVDWPDGPTRVFYSDDPDTGDATDAATDGNTSLANVTDVYYRNTTPEFTADGTTLAEYRRQQLRRVERSRDDSKYLPFSNPEDSSGGVIEDAHVTLLGVVGGGRPMVDGADAPLYIPGDGEVLNYLDYRVDESELPSRTENEEYGGPNETRVRKNYQIDWSQSGVDQREVRVNGREVGQASGDPDARVIDYEDASGSGTVQLRIEATITIRMTYDVVTYNNGTVTDREQRSARAGRLSVSDSTEVHVIDDQAVTLRQRFVEIEGQSTDRLLVAVEGPEESLQRRQLWSTLEFEGPSVVRNNWGVYSTTQYAHGYVAEDGDERRFDFPHVLTVKFTSSFGEPYANTNYSAGDVAGSPRLVGVEQTNYSDETPSLGPWVNVTTTRPTFVHEFEVEDAPSRIQSGTGLFGREVAVESEPTITVHEARVDVSKVNESHAKVRLFDPDTGDGIGGRTLALSGAARESVTTPADGVVVVNRTNRILRASFSGDDWREDHREGGLDPSRSYYGSAHDDLLVIEKGLLWTGLVDVIWGFVLASPFVLGWVWIRSMDTVL